MLVNDDRDLGAWFAVDGVAIKDELQLWVAVIDTATAYDFQSSKAWNFACEQAFGEAHPVEWESVHAALMSGGYNLDDNNLLDVIYLMYQLSVRHLTRLLPDKKYYFDTDVLCDVDEEGFGTGENARLAFGLYRK